MIYQPSKELSLYQAIEEVLTILQTENIQELILRFNDIDLRIQQTSHVYDIEEKYLLKHTINCLKLDNTY